MPRKNKSFLGRRSGALDVQGEVCLDNPGVVIDGMTRIKDLYGAAKAAPLQSVAFSEFFRSLAGPRPWNLVASGADLHPRLKSRHGSAA